MLSLQRDLLHGASYSGVLPLVPYASRLALLWLPEVSV